MQEQEFQKTHLQVFNQVVRNIVGPIGYLPSGSHPKTPGELVDNVEVCYNCNNEICFYRSRNIWQNITNNVVKIRHCGEYFVYYLTKAFTNQLRYCTE